ncbi:hypothetical protein A2774_00460 [Candidatus Roizmanbacteria bacterium RIFCSPHIGHO2_01_FULL_39_12c]|uniref:Nudix hydrolase domain-containing protein n=1 Tax=Candidatus Roizmanbacteria bacterium RIFCSPHIGHO2_01_FULL_39_12c TaxID=1802031 RepID=A0A1F7GDM6_9BACT|nr:MAG: hypothetical protein A2774_00460 [Candidatus Roizmanbacteria bacterium RIFCSPHIGHO2_01_FULL_39_12c]
MQLRNLEYVDQRVAQKFLDFINGNQNYFRDNNPDRHICSFFLPYDEKRKLIYLGHHKKAKDWIPPGGHINQGENPLNTVYREFQEELNHQLTDEKVQLFNLSIKDISGNPLHKCKTHYDFWYLVRLKKKNFKFDRNEFYQAKWLTIPQALRKMKLLQYANIIKKLQKIYFS